MTKIDQLEQAQEVSEGSDSPFFEFSGAYCYMISPFGSILRINRAACEGLGYKEEELLGKPLTTIHAPESQAKVRDLLRSGNTVKLCSEEMVILTKDGEERTVLQNASSVMDPEGKLLYSTCVQMDITERKRMEHELRESHRRTMSQRLIEAREQERSRLARELHDDIQQRLALLAVGLECLKQELPTSAAKLKQDIGSAHKQLVDLTSDIRTLSHRLDSSKLEHLGLTRATTAFCTELFAGEGEKIAFHADNIPEKLPQEISLCLFRVLQEALHNAIKHSGSRFFRVSLCGRTNEIELTVRDTGRGFEPEKALNGLGLGLTSMRERLKTVDGRLSIDSKLQRGTTIRALVPFIQREVQRQSSSTSR